MPGQACDNMIATTYSAYIKSRQDHSLKYYDKIYFAISLKSPNVNL